MNVPHWLERMSGERMGALTLGFGLLCAIGYILLRSSNNPGALAAITGCYAAPRQPAIDVSSDGILSFAGQQVRVTGYSDKGGIALSPERMVMIDRQDQDRLKIDSSYPQLLRYDEAHRELAIPDVHGGQPVIFQRDAGLCVPTDRG